MKIISIISFILLLSINNTLLSEDLKTYIDKISNQKLSNTELSRRIKIFRDYTRSEDQLLESFNIRLTPEYKSLSDELKKKYSRESELRAVKNLKNKIAKKYAISLNTLEDIIDQGIVNFW